MASAAAADPDPDPDDEGASSAEDNAPWGLGSPAWPGAGLQSWPSLVVLASAQRT